MSIECRQVLTLLNSKKNVRNEVRYSVINIMNGINKRITKPKLINSLDYLINNNLIQVVEKGCRNKPTLYKINLR